MGKRSSKETLPEARGFLGTLLVAWTFVTGCVAVIASAYYYRSGSIEVLVSWLAAPFLVGILLFLAMGMSAMATRVQGGTRVTTVEKPTGMRRRRDIHGRK